MKYTYRQAFDLITEAYIKGKIEPYIGSFCFCGTLDIQWQYTQDNNEESRYSLKEYRKMEKALLVTINNGTVKHKGHYFLSDENGAEMRIRALCHPNYEKALFDGMCAALEVLKQIHIKRGEVIDSDVPVFTKRQLQTA